MLHLQYHCLNASCFFVPSTAKSLMRASPMILIGTELWTKLGSGIARASAPKRPVHETLHSAKQVNANHSATIDPPTVVGISLATHDRKYVATTLPRHNSSFTDQGMHSGLYCCVRIWPKKSTLVNH